MKNISNKITYTNFKSLFRPKYLPRFLLTGLEDLSDVLEYTGIKQVHPTVDGSTHKGRWLFDIVTNLRIGKQILWLSI